MHPRSRLVQAAVSHKCGKTGHSASVCRSGSTGRSTKSPSASAAALGSAWTTTSLLDDSAARPREYWDLHPVAASPVLASVVTPRNSTIPLSVN